MSHLEYLVRECAHNKQEWHKEGVEAHLEEVPSVRFFQEEGNSLSKSWREVYDTSLLHDSLMVKLQNLWEITTKMELIELGKGFFITIFEDGTLASNILSQGP